MNFTAPPSTEASESHRWGVGASVAGQGAGRRRPDRPPVLGCLGCEFGLCGHQGVVKAF